MIFYEVGRYHEINSFFPPPNKIWRWVYNHLSMTNQFCSSYPFPFIGQGIFIIYSTYDFKTTSIYRNVFPFYLFFLLYEAYVSKKKIVFHAIWHVYHMFILWTLTFGYKDATWNAKYIYIYIFTDKSLMILKRRFWHFVYRQTFDHL